MRKFFKEEIFYFKNWKKTGIKAGFTTKHFPVFMQRTEALKDPIVQAQFLQRFPGNFVVLNQVHSDGVVVIDNAINLKKSGFRHFPESDGVITNIKDLTLLVFTADCLPVFISGGGWVGLVHAGWKGTRLGIAQKAVKTLAGRAGISTSRIKALFGPCIRKKNYEVGPEFLKIFPKTTVCIKNKHYFDLAKENSRQLAEIGVPVRAISDSGIDTYSENKDFYSFRREKTASGRLVSFICHESKVPEGSDPSGTDIR